MKKISKKLSSHADISAPLKTGKPQMISATGRKFFGPFFQKRTAFLLCLICLAMAPRPQVAIADFDYIDTSGEPSDHAARLAEFTHMLRQGYAADGRFNVVSLACAAPRCSAGGLPPGMLEQAAAGAHARLLVFGGLHKMSTLVQWMQIEVLDVQTGHLRLSRTLSFRGDDAEAWRHAARYVSAMILAVGPG